MREFYRIMSIDVSDELRAEKLMYRNLLLNYYYELDANSEEAIEFFDNDEDLECICFYADLDPCVAKKIASAIKSKSLELPNKRQWPKVWNSATRKGMFITRDTSHLNRHRESVSHEAQLRKSSVL